jgi:hypothetical protein
LNNYNKVPFYYTRKRVQKKKGAADAPEDIHDAEKGGRLAHLM